MICEVLNCGLEAGNSLACVRCRKYMGKAQKKHIHDMWRRIGVEKGRIGEMYKCHHCEQMFPRDMVTSDHYPYTRGARPDLRYNIYNSVCSCQLCNTSGTDTRKIPTQEDYDAVIL
jgi:hypothetical protein